MYESREFKLHREILEQWAKGTTFLYCPECEYTQPLGVCGWCKCNPPSRNLRIWKREDADEAKGLKEDYPCQIEGNKPNK